jgi:Kef-type K+ transport system membrane component KefB/mannitol/fructose-specific phosphotransferase system IIA component (Ntr-type)
MSTVKKILLLCSLFFAIFAIPFFACAAEEPNLAGEPGMTYRMMMLAIQLGIILFAARIGNIFAEKLKFPGVLGELLIGIIIGPFMLGAIPLPGFSGGLFPIASGKFPVTPELYGFCSVASIVLLFTAGLETDIRLFLRYSVVGALVGIGGVVFSFLAGDLLAVILLPRILGGEYTFFSPSSIFLGVMSTATSVGISARILSEKKKIDSPEGVTILAGAVIDDVIGIIMLAIGLGVISASSKNGAGLDWWHIGIVASKAVGIWLAATAVGIIAARRISSLLKIFRDKSQIALMGLGLALIIAALFEEAHLAMIIGAYVVGLSLSRTDISRVITETLHPVYYFLVPIFFTVMGMLVDIRLLQSWKIIEFGILYSALAVMAKILGCGIPTLFCNFNLRGALRVGAGMIPRGEVALIVAGIGLAAGILSSEVFAVGIMMTLLTTLLAPPIMVLLFQNEKSGIKRQPEKEKTRRELVFKFPSHEIAAHLSGDLSKSFEREGFYVHRLTPDGANIQIRKDASIISFQNSAEQIIFDCSENDEQFVKTAMIEIIADFEQIIKELRRPIDVKSVVKDVVPSQVNGKNGKIKLSQFLIKDAIIPHLKGDNKKEIIEELLASLSKSGALKDFSSAKDAVMKREESMSTGLQFGVAIPHGKTNTVETLTATVGLKPDGVDFNSLDKLPSKIFVLAVSPERGYAPHMQFMATIGNILNEEGREKILECKTKDQIFEFMTQ